MYMVVLILFLDRVSGGSVVLDRNRADCHPSNRPCSAHACAGPCNKPLRWASVIRRHGPDSEDQSFPVNGRRRLLLRLSTGRSDLWCLALHLSTGALGKARLIRWRRRARRWISRNHWPPEYRLGGQSRGRLPSPCRLPRYKSPRG